MLAVLLPLSPILAGVNPPGYPPFAAGDYVAAGLGPREPEVVVEFPGSAATRGVPKGNAVVSVLIDVEGKGADFLVIGCTDLAFGKALLEEAKTLRYQAAKFRGVPVPARFEVGYNFEANSIAGNPMDGARLRADKLGRPVLVYSAVPVSKLDHGLEPTNAALPEMPADYQAADSQPVKVFVTFYVDEQGKVRAPNVESAASPALIAGAIKAVLQWSFKPPLAKGQPVLVFTGRPVGFVPRKQ